MYIYIYMFLAQPFWLKVSISGRELWGGGPFAAGLGVLGCLFGPLGACASRARPRFPWAPSPLAALPSLLACRGLPALPSLASLARFLLSGGCALVLIGRRVYGSDRYLSIVVAPWPWFSRSAPNGRGPSVFRGVSGPRLPRGSYRDPVRSKWWRPCRLKRRRRQADALFF